MHQTPLREDEHRLRSQRHQLIGDLLADAGDEWGAVPMFYSAYHCVKGALLRDPIFDHQEALTKIHRDLYPEDRHVNRHHGRRRQGQQADWGVNELVGRLYSRAAGDYERLHQGSIQVRYGTGLPSGALPALRICLANILEMESRGDLEASIPH